MKNIAYIGSWKHFVFVFVCVWVSLSLYLSFCKSSSRPMSSPDDKLSENIWFVWSKTSYGGDKWKCHAWTRTHRHVNIELEFSETEFAIQIYYRYHIWKYKCTNTIEFEFLAAPPEAVSIHPSIGRTGTTQSSPYDVREGLLMLTLLYSDIGSLCLCSVFEWNDI